MSDLQDLCAAATTAGTSGEQVEAYAADNRRTEVRARGGEVEGLAFSESRGLGVRVVRDGRVGFAFVADPRSDDVRDAVTAARENALLAEPDDANGLPEHVAAAEPMPELYSAAQASMPVQEKVSAAIAMERRATSIDPRVRHCDDVVIADAVERIAIASTSGIVAEAERTDSWCYAVALAVEGDETQTGYSFKIGREIGDLGWEEVADEAVRRATSMLGATKPPSERVPIVLDPFAGSAFLGVLAGALSAEAVQKGRSLFAGREGEKIGSGFVTVIDDGRDEEGPSAAPFDDEGVPTGKTVLIEGGILRGFLHNTYTARRGDVSSTGNAKRAGYRSSPGVGTTALKITPGKEVVSSILARGAGGVLVNEVSGVHSGANPISGTFSVGATGWRIGDDGSPGEPLREMTIASTTTEMLAGIAGVGDDLRWFSSVGVPTLLIGEMTIGGV